MTTNRDRVNWADVALLAFARETGLDLIADGPETVVSDLVADLRHYCTFRGIPWSEVTRRANGHFRAEKHGFE